MARFVDAVETKTGKKVRIPEQWLRLYPKSFKARPNPRTERVTEPHTEKENR